MKLLAILLALLLASTASAESSHRTANFAVTAPDAQSAEIIAQASEAWRRQHAQEWLGRELPDWSEPQIVTATFATHNGGGATNFTHGPAGFIPGYGKWEGPPQVLLDDVVPHEVLHLVLHAHLGQPIPRWLDEGAASAVESHATQQKFREWTIEALSASPSRGFPLNTLMSLEQYPADPSVTLRMYFQSHSLVAFLLEQRSKQDYTRFLERGLEIGWSPALVECYGLDPSRLQIAWVEWLRGGGGQPVVVNKPAEITWVYQSGAWCQDGSCRTTGGVIQQQQIVQPRRLLQRAPAATQTVKACACDPKALAASIAALKAEVATIAAKPPPAPAAAECPCDLEGLEARLLAAIEQVRVDIPPAAPDRVPGRKFVVIADPRGRYYKSLSEEVAKTATRFDAISLHPPPADRNVGTLPALVLFVDGIPAVTYRGTSDVRLQLSRIRRGEFQ